MLRLKRKNVNWSQIMEGRNLAFLMVLPLDPMMKLLLLTVIMKKLQGSQVDQNIWSGQWR